jgi:hypothetical protein
VRKILNVYSLVILFVVLFTLSHFIFPLDKLNAIFDNFNKVAIGISALIAAYAGSIYFIEEFQRKRLIDMFGRRYPTNNYGKKWKIIVREDRTGEPHVLDMDNRIKHHIWNMKTIYDLSWQFHDREPVRKDEFDSYKIGERVRTRGDLGE